MSSVGASPMDASALDVGALLGLALLFGGYTCQATSRNLIKTAIAFLRSAIGSNRGPDLVLLRTLLTGLLSVPRQMSRVAQYAMALPAYRLRYAVRCVPLRGPNWRQVSGGSAMT